MLNPKTLVVFYFTTIALAERIVRTLTFIISGEALLIIRAMQSPSSRSDVSEVLDEHPLSTGLDERNPFLKLHDHKMKPDNHGPTEAQPERRSEDRGINCDGSGLCMKPMLKEIEKALQMGIDDGDGDIVFQSGQQITCAGEICVFYDSGANGTVVTALDLVHKLQAYGCHNCGSVATAWGQYVELGQLTVNYVDVPLCTWPLICKEGINFRKRSAMKKRAERQNRWDLARGDWP